MTARPTSRPFNNIVFTGPIKHTRPSALGTEHFSYLVGFYNFFMHRHPTVSAKALDVFERSVRLVRLCGQILLPRSHERLEQSQLKLAGNIHQTILITRHRGKLVTMLSGRTNERTNERAYGLPENIMPSATMSDGIGIKMPSSFRNTW